MSEPGNVPLNDLARRCQEETIRFKQRLEHDDRFCFELLRRALQLMQNDAFTAVYRIYEPQVLAWARSNSRLAATGQSAEYFVNGAFGAWYFALRGPKFERFPTLQKVLAYLQVTVYSAIRQIRPLPAPPPQPPDQEPLDLPAPDPDPSARARFQELWKHVCVVLPDKLDQLLSYCALVLGMKPSEITIKFPRHWKDAREVTVALYRIRARLRNDPELGNWLLE